MFMENLLISVVIPCYNGKDLLSANLPKWLEMLKAERWPFEIIISDDASTDGAADWVEAHFAEINVVRAKANCGFAGNFNRGAAMAGGKFILALNTDVEPIQGFLSPMLEHFLKDQDVFAVGVKLKGYDTQIQDAGKWPDYHWTGLKSTRDFIPNPDEAVETWFCSAACCLYDAEKFKLLGGFDELFNPYYYEDADLCFRAWCRGWKSIYEPRAEAFHPNSVTIQKHHTSGKIRIVANRNKLFLNFRYLKGWPKMAFVLLLIAKLLTAWIGKRWLYQSFCLFLSKQKEFKRKNETLEGGTLRRVAARIQKQQQVRFSKPF